MDLRRNRQILVAIRITMRGQKQDLCSPQKNKTHMPLNYSIAR